MRMWHIRVRPSVADLPKFWSTTVAKVLVGEQPCLFSAWAKGHLKYDARPREDGGDLARWKADHTAQLDAHVAAMKAEGWKVDKERFFKVQGQTAELSGKCDAVLQAKDRRPRIDDIKSGKPRDSDVAQVLIEMIMLPLAWGTPQMVFDGLVIYPTRTITVTPKQADEFKPRLMAMMRRLGESVEPGKDPSRDACRWCEIPDALCAVRYAGELVGTVAEF